MRTNLDKNKTVLYAASAFMGMLLLAVVLVTPHLAGQHNVTAVQFVIRAKTVILVAYTVLVIIILRRMAKACRTAFENRWCVCPYCLYVLDHDEDIEPYTADHNNRDSLPAEPKIPTPLMKVCPECGNPVDQKTLIKHWWPLSQSAWAKNRRTIPSKREDSIAQPSRDR